MYETKAHCLTLEYFKMKKNLIALAVLAATSASFAQVTITGNLAMGYKATSVGGSTAVGSADASGFGVDTSQIDFAASEDLGGGMKLTAKMALGGADRSGESGTGAVLGRDASLALKTNMGTLTLASRRGGDYLTGGIAGVDAYYIGFDSSAIATTAQTKVFGARSVRDGVSYALPIGPVSLSAAYEEASYAGTSTAGLGLGVGTSGAEGTTKSRRLSLGATYKSGPLVANATYLTFDSTARLSGPQPQKSEMRLSGSYDLGMVKVGLGTVSKAYEGGAATGAKVTDTLLGLSVPMGALTLGAQFAMRKMDDAALSTARADSITVDGQVSGTSLQANYALSKRTNLIASYARWTAFRVANNDASTETTMLISHSF
jgi:predicted porin